MKRLALLLVLIVLLSACSNTAKDRSVAEWWQEAQPAARQFADNMTVADSTSRISLAPVIQDMQQDRRAFAAINCPPEAGSARTAILAAMDASIDYFLAFMSNGQDAVTDSATADVLAAWDNATAELDSLGIRTAPAG